MKQAATEKINMLIIMLLAIVALSYRDTPQGLKPCSF
jgi:hypothetical protein